MCDICHIYDNSYTTEGGKTHRIFKKRKEQCFYHENTDWHLEDIKALTEIADMQQKDLNMCSSYYITRKWKLNVRFLIPF